MFMILFECNRSPMIDNAIPKLGQCTSRLCHAILQSVFMLEFEYLNFNVQYMTVIFEIVCIFVFSIFDLMFACVLKALVQDLLNLALQMNTRHSFGSHNIRHCLIILAFASLQLFHTICSAY